MAELVGGALLSGFLNVLFDRMASKEIVEFFRGKKAIPKLLKELKIMLISANALLNDAEEKQLQDQNVKNWLEELKDLIYEADHVIDKISTEALRCEIEEGGQSESMTMTKCLTCFPVRSSLLDRAVKVELEQILASLKLLLEQSGPLGLKEGVKRSSTVARTLTLVEESDVCGRDDEKKSLIELLLSDADSLPKISVIPIVGMGGIGKTTLAHVVYNDVRVQKHFDCKAWVTVSEEFDVPRLTKVIFQSITSGKCDIEDPHGIQSALYEALRGKKFLLVHDDVWNEKYELWDALQSAFQSGAHGSKIIVTTRSDIVAKQMGNVKPYRLGGISEDDCWALFRKHVFGNVDEHSDWKEIGIQFVKKCKGLPLAVKSIAGLLKSTMGQEAWREILESDIWGMEFREVNSTNILPALWLSYSFLPPNLKRCFAFLSVFPKDYEFHDGDLEKIMLMWMAEGILQPQNNRRAEDVGKEYLNVLISRSFFQHSRYSTEVLIMHDLIHDLALFVSSGLHSSSSKIRYIFLKETSENFPKLEKSIDTMFLRTLMIISPMFPSFIYMLVQNVLREVFPKVGCLRELSLFASSIKELPDSIGTLKYLRYLDLSKTMIKELPTSLCLLYNLQTLLLTKCSELRCLPTALSRLIKLRHLDIKGTCLKEMPPQMCNMKDLQALRYYVLGENQSSRIKDLGGLQLLRGSLRLRQLQNVITVEDALGANMKNKKYLDKIRFEWDRDITCEDPERETEVLNALEPHSGIKEVKIIGFGGTKLPNSVAKQSFRDIVKASLIDCRNCVSLPPFGELPSLKDLKIEGLNGVVSIGDEFSGTTNKPFPSLESLSIENMCAWEKWSFSGSVSLFPCLKELTIEDCNNLMCGLPNCSTLPALESVCVEKCKILESFSSSGMGLPSSLKFVYVSNCPQLMLNRLSWGLHKLSSLQYLSLEGDIEDDSFPEEGLLPNGLKQLFISDCESLKGLNDKGFQNLTALSQLSILYCPQLQHLPAEGLPMSLNELTIDGCLLLNNQCERETGHYWPKIQHIPQITIDFYKI